MTDSMGKEQGHGIPALPYIKPLSYSESAIHPEVRTVIDSLDPLTPSVFKRQAQETAGFIQLLDEGKGLDDPRIKKFIRQLISTDFILSPQVESPQQLPKWLQMDFLVANGVRKPFKAQKDLPDPQEYTRQFDKWIRETGIEIDGNSFVFDPTPRASLPRSNKAYIEHEALMSAYTQGRLPILINNFTEEGYPLFAVKSNRESLVLYFNGDIAEFEKADKAFKRTGIEYRGPGQDVYIVRLRENGKMTVSSMESNDQTFTRHNGYLRESAYSSKSFLRDYLVLCHKMGKNPAMPYLTSFVYFISDTNLGVKEQEFLKQASLIAGYPVLYRGIPNLPVAKPPPGIK